MQYLVYIVLSAMALWLVLVIAALYASIGGAV